MAYVSKTCMCTQNRYINQNIDISKNCLNRLTISVTLHFRIITVVVPPSEALLNSIFIFDDIVCDKQNAIREYFEKGYFKINCFYLYQTCKYLK